MSLTHWFPYTPRPHQHEAIDHALRVFSNETVGLLAAECGVGKTIAALSAYFTARMESSDWDDIHLIILTRTHSQSDVFEAELKVLQELMAKKGRTMTTTCMVSRRHICPMRESMEDLSNAGFIRACASLIKQKHDFCHFYWNFYNRDSNGGAVIKRTSLDLVDEMLSDGIISSDSACETATREAICPYELLRWCAKNSRIIIGPYGYLFIERSRKAFLGSLGKGLSSIDMIVDEAHNLADYVLESESASITGADLQWLRNNTRDVRDTGIQWLTNAVDFLWDALQLVFDKKTNGGELQLARWDVIPRFTDKTELEQQLQSARDALDDIDGIHLSERYVEKLITFLYTGIKAVDSDDWLYTVQVPRTYATQYDLSMAKLRIRPLNAAGLTAPVLWRCRSALLMSGTLRPLQHYARLLGVMSDRTQYADIPSPYPSDSQLILIDKDITTRYKERTADTWRHLASRIRTALTSIPGDKSAFIAFPSYDMLHEVVSHGLQDSVDLGFRKRIVETRDARIESFRRELEKGPTAIFCVFGGKFSEGIDLVKNGSSMINLIIGVGIPFSPPSSYQKTLQEWYEHKFGKNQGYYYAAVVPSVRRVAQLLGRLRRSPDDWGVCVLLDKRFHRYLSVLGERIVSQAWPYSGEDDMKNAIEMFIRLHERGNVT